MRYRKLVDGFRPYEWELSNRELSARYGVPEEKIVRMDLNTVPYLPVKWLEILQQRLLEIPINLYPDTSYRELRELLGEYAGVDLEQLVVTAGADEAIDLTAKLLIDPGSKAIASTPTYSFFRIPVELMGGRVVEVPRISPGFKDDLSGILEKIDAETRLVFLCHPNNPTGTPVEPEIVDRLLKEDVTLVIDETYYEFLGRSYASLTKGNDNLIIIRSFSKGFGLAGARVGYMIASEHTAMLLNKLRPPNSVGVISLELAKIALENKDAAEKVVGKIIEERERVRRKLEKIPGITVYPSEANFLLIRFDEEDAGKVHEALLRRGYVVRNLSSIPGLENCLRITISTPENNEGFLDAFIDVLGE